jgi:hypothetical protein
MIKNIAYDIHNKGQDTERVEDVINNGVSLNTHLEKGIKIRVNQAKFIQGRDEHNNTRSPEGSLNIIPKDKPNNLAHIKCIIAKVKGWFNQNGTLPCEPGVGQFEYWLRRAI